MARALTNLLTGIIASMALSTGYACEKMALPLNFSNIPLLPSVEVMLDGTKKTFLLDTGTDLTTLSVSNRDLYTLSRRRVRVAGLAGSTQMALSKVNSLTAGEIRLNDMSVAVELERSIVSDNWDGVLGADALFQEDIEISYADGYVKHYPKGGCKPEWIVSAARALIVPSKKHDTLEIEVVINGAKVTAIVDTGATASFLTGEAFRRLALKESDDSSPVVFAGFGSTGRTAKTIKVDILSIGTANYSGVQLHTAADNGAGVALLLGADFLASRRIYLSRRTGHMYFDAGEKFSILKSGSSGWLELLGARGNIFAQNRLSAMQAQKRIAELVVLSSRSRRTGDVDGAERYIQQALLLNPKSQVALVERYMVRLAGGRNDLARAELMESTAQARTGQWSDVVYEFLLNQTTMEDFTEKLVNDPRSAESRCALAGMLWELGLLKRQNPSIVKRSMSLLCLPRRAVDK